MRLTALLPAACALIAIILSFLCLFAGSKRAFLEDYNILTLNTSRIGQNILNSTLGGGDGPLPDIPNPFANTTIPDIPNPLNTSGSDPLANLTDPFSGINITDPLSTLVPRDLDDSLSNLTSSLNSDLNSLISSIARDLGLSDFYSAHLLTYCSGTYTPQPVPNASVPLSSIRKSTTYCSAPSADFQFNPTAVLSDALANATGLDITLDDLDWPAGITAKLNELRAAWSAAIAFYILAIAFTFLALFAAIAVLFTAPASHRGTTTTATTTRTTNGRRASFLPPIHLALHATAFLSLLLASAIVTTIAIDATTAINKFGNAIGVAAVRGSGLLGLTWAAAGLEFLGAGCGGWMWWSRGRGAGRRDAARRGRGTEGSGEKLVGGSPRREGWV
ncbi:hypothetical protein K490DRAFT_59963 [Saccharata proteae CBS 121410]|uniref:Uncharacterized protein n=1 Tax=Saccharata proteae CBS 121410 TaxID=1314787 RepID=A0A9P4HLV8_9PEZI|nr:hypothetical protein K490DRAFT_59963 [Saccharata proteae CBS 121410]